MKTYNIDPLIRARKLKRWSRTDLGAAIGRSDNMIWKIENGQSQSEKTIFLMSKSLGVPMSRILVDSKKRRAS